MKSLRLTVAGVLAAALLPSAVRAGILLNEVHLNVPGSDGNFEFIELKSTTDGKEACTGLSIVIINNDKIDSDTNLPRTVGEVREIYSLNDLSTGTNGLLLLGNGYTSNPRGGPWSGFVDPATAVADPQGMGDSDIGSNDGLTILLVKDATAQLIKGANVDVNGNGVFDWVDAVPPANRQFATQPWGSVADAIGTRDRGKDNGDVVFEPYVSNAANINKTWSTAPNISTLADRDPDTFARQLGNNVPSSALSWYGGKLHGSTPTTITYETNRFFGPGSPQMLGEVTPGRANLASTLGATSFRINEVGLNPAGQGNDRFQYIEIINTGTTANGFVPTARSLNGYWLVLVDSYDSGSVGDTTGVGSVIEKWDLSSMATGTNGLLLIGNDFSASFNTFQDLASPLSGFGDPESHDAVAADLDNGIPAIPAATGMGEGDIGYKNGFSLFLVQNLPATVPADVDPGDTGTMTVPLIPAGNPTSTIVDQVGFSQVGRTTGKGHTYCSVDLRSVMDANLVPDNFSRKPKIGNQMAVAATEWYGGSYPGGSPGFDVAFDVQKKTPDAGGAAYDSFFGGFRGAGTPGLPNLSGSIKAESPPIPAKIRINEVMINPTNFPGAGGTDDNREYIELASDNNGLAYLDNLWVIIVDLSGTIGEVVHSFPLDGSMTGLNGIAVIGDNYDSSTTPYDAVDGPKTPFATWLDPVRDISGDDLPNNGMALMILRNPKTTAGSILTLSADGLRLTGDLDPENDGVLVPPSALADEVVDSIVVNTINPGAGYGWINSTAFKPDHIARLPGNTTPNPANGATSYYWGEISQTGATLPALEYSGNFAGPFKGAGSPGRPNHGASTGSIDEGAVLLNELNFDPPGADNNFEFVELLDKAGKRRSLNGYYLVMIDNVATNTGAIRHFWSLDGMTTGDNGLFLLGNRYPLGGTDNPWSAVMRAGTTVGDPPGREGLSTSLSDGSLGDETDNLNLCLLLVRNFSGYIGFDLDQKGGNPPADSPGDGVFDQSAWLISNPGTNPTGIHDSVMFRDFIKVSPDPVLPPPGYPWDGFAYPGIADIGALYLEPPAHVFYHPDSIARLAGQTAINSAAAWYGGDLNGGVSGNSGTGVQYVTGDASHPPFPAGLVSGRATPGQPNLALSGSDDPDGDGIPTFLELAFGSNPNAPDAVSPLPVAGTVTDSGNVFGSITYRRIRGGTATGSVYSAETYTYTIQTSTDLNTWTDAGTSVTQQGTPVANGDVESVTFRLNTPTNGTGSIPRTYMRLRVSRS